MGKNEEREKNYWGYRIDVKNQDFFFKELEQGRLRQGWGYAENQKLPETEDSGARKNLSMYKNVKKRDILLIPRLPDWGSVAIAEAAEDWDNKEKGYRFEIAKLGIKGINLKLMMKRKILDIFFLQDILDVLIDTEKMFLEIYKVR